MDFESLLDRCKAQGLTSLSLNWHYRSRHEDLITYSNRKFYDGRLHTFPSPHDHDGLGVELFHVEGVYNRGTTRDNPVEAAKVVDRILHHRRSDPDATIGVVALSTHQQTAIETEIDRRAATEPELCNLPAEERLSGFFVKNLESVQGDERDIVILSIGYGPDENNRLTMNFGPMNRAGGERRLNVAVTRARRRMEVVASITAGDISSPATPAVSHLRSYLDYAARGRAALALDHRGSLGPPESPFEEEVLRCIEAMGHNPAPQVGAAGYRIDIAVRCPRKPGSYVLGIECDGATYHSSKVARDRDRLRQQVLEGLGWAIHRIWSTAWFTNRPAEEARLRSAIDNAASQPVAAPPRPDRRPAPFTVTTKQIDIDAKPVWAKDYLPPKPPRSPRPAAEFDALESRSVLASHIQQVVSNHGPIHQEAVLRCLRDGWSLDRVNRRARSAFDAAVAQVCSDGAIRKQDVWLSIAGQEPSVQIPVSADAPRRSVQEVPPDEIRMSVEAMLRDAGRCDPEQLRRGWARLYGWARTGSGIDAAFDKALQALLDSGTVQSNETFDGSPPRA